MDLPTLITAGELVVHLDIPGVADLVTFDIIQVLVGEVEGPYDLRDHPWLDLCRLANKINGKKFYDGIAWCFLNATRATRSPEGALWACQIGQTVHNETGYQRLWTYGLYLCVAWGAFGHPAGPTLPRAMVYGVQLAQGILVAVMNGLDIPQLCDVHEPQCVGGDVRRYCVEYWEAVWRQAHQVARERLSNEYDKTNLGGVKRDVLRMLPLITLALQDITQTRPVEGALRICDVKRLHASNDWLLANQGMIRSIINGLL